MIRGNDDADCMLTRGGGRSMMKLVRRVVLALVLVPHPPSAECACGVWQDGPARSGGGHLDVGAQVVFPTQEACEQQLKARSEFINEANRTSRAQFLVCLPDTVDPRGPKVK